MRPDDPSGNVVDLDTEELEEFLESEHGEAFAETAMAIPAQRANRTPPADAVRTGPGRSESPANAPTAQLRKTPTPSGPVVRAARQSSRPSSQVRAGRTASLRKSAESDALHSDRPNSRASIRKPVKEQDERIGSILGSYRILSVIGEGGMGKVYCAEHVKLGRKVALKLLRPEYAVKRDAVARFFNEAQSVNKISHDNIVDITDFVELESGETFIIMELLEGTDLSELIRNTEHPLPLDRAMQISLQICDALEAAHRVSVIHRDLKPDNVFIVNTANRKDFVKLLDFGVAKLLGEATEADGWKTAAGSVIGTPAYMSPEQASGIPADERSDIYSLGAILYELFTGHPVFRAKSFGEYVIKHMNDEPVAPRNLTDAPRIPSALERVILRCLEKDPNRRYQSVSGLRDDLSRATTTAQTVERVAAEQVRPVRSRHRKLVLILLLTTIAITALAITAFWLAAGLGNEETAKFSRELSAPTVEVQPTQPRKERIVAATEPLPPSKLVTARVRLETQPSGADVFSKGDHTSLGRTPLDLRLTNIGEVVEFVYRLDGYKEAVEKVTVTDNALFTTALEKKTQSAVVKKIRVRGGKRAKGKVDSGLGASKADPKVKHKKPGQVNPEDQVDPFR